MAPGGRSSFSFVVNSARCLTRTKSSCAASRRSCDTKSGSVRNTSKKAGQEGAIFAKCLMFELSTGYPQFFGLTKRSINTKIGSQRRRAEGAEPPKGTSSSARSARALSGLCRPDFSGKRTRTNFSPIFSEMSGVSAENSPPEPPFEVSCALRNSRGKTNTIPLRSRIPRRNRDPRLLILQLRGILAA